MHDEDLKNFSHIARQYLNEPIPGKWIGRNVSVAWPPRSPDLSPIDFYISGHVEIEVFSKSVTNFDELSERILAAFDIIRKQPGQLNA